ncbi:Core-2/I-Branching enzyme [Necator americanus]|uniref:Core-2/I-Branching enzyme n=1 Tax=Necator americanus TaxID=51031 RepID=W2TNM3_NECAM|nr:Core-2/I-Branching enzyme [Necator americanus]ETN83259.1 Core-2/I-Branching enzyme [Necator americanus]
MIPYHIIMIALMALSTFYFIFMLGNKYSSWNYITQTSFPIGLQTYKDLLDGIGTFFQILINVSIQIFEGKNSEVNCKGILRGDENATLQAKNWTFDTYPIEERLFFAQDRCRAIDDLFGFNMKTTSQEELDFPLAYGAVVYTNLVQVLFMLSAFYRRHNEYCVAHRPPISWGSFEIINSTWACVEQLARTKTKWKYYQQLSGVDVPLKTNLEMVKILKALNNTVNAEISKFQKDRLTEKKYASTSTYVLYVNVLITIFLNVSESGMDQGNFTVPGGANAAQWMKFRDEYRKNHEEVVVEYEKSAVKEALMNYYLARHQIWDSPCGGEFVQGSCVYGVSDVSNVLKQPHLIAHKMYLHFQPAAFFCVLKELRNRERKPIALNLTQYAKLPQVELSAGVPHENITHPLWMFGE